MTLIVEARGDFLPRLPNNAKARTRGGVLKISRERKAQARYMGWKFRASRPPRPLMRARALFLRVSSVEPDDDGNAAAFKWIRDQLELVGVIESDAPKHLQAEYGWAKCSPREGHIIVRVWDAEADPTEGWWND
jgi:hypothetical protein